MKFIPPLLLKWPPRFKEWGKKHGKTAFWVWVGYQAIKGILTTSLIWVPLILATCHFSK